MVQVYESQALGMPLCECFVRSKTIFSNDMQQCILIFIIYPWLQVRMIYVYLKLKFYKIGKLKLDSMFYLLYIKIKENGLFLILNLNFFY